MKIYVASPYSDEDAMVRQQRWREVCWLLAQLVQKHPTYIFYSPIAHWHITALNHDLPKDHKFWENQNETMIDWADQVWIYCLPGWENSKGIKSEITYVARQSKRIEFIDYTIDHISLEGKVV